MSTIKNFQVEDAKVYKTARQVLPGEMFLSGGVYYIANSIGKKGSVKATSLSTGDQYELPAHMTVRVISEVKLVIKF